MSIVYDFLRNQEMETGQMLKSVQQNLDDARQKVIRMERQVDDWQERMDEIQEELKAYE